MGEIISAQVSGELEERYNEAAEDRDEDLSESAFIREILDEGLYAREQPLFVQLDIPDRIAAQLEADREQGESQEAVIARHLKEAVDGRNEGFGLPSIGLMFGGLFAGTLLTPLINPAYLIVLCVLAFALAYWGDKRNND